MIHPQRIVLDFYKRNSGKIVARGNDGRTYAVCADERWIIFGGKTTGGHQELLKNMLTQQGLAQEERR